MSYHSIPNTSCSIPGDCAAPLICTTQKPPSTFPPGSLPSFHFFYSSVNLSLEDVRLADVDARLDVQRGGQYGTSAPEDGAEPG